MRLVLVTITVVYTLALILYLALRVTLGDGVWWLALANNFAPFYRRALAREKATPFERQLMKALWALAGC